MHSYFSSFLSDCYELLENEDYETFTKINANNNIVNNMRSDDIFDDTFLMKILSDSKTNIIKYLIKEHADVTMKHSIGLTCFHRAAMSGTIDAMNLFLLTKSSGLNVQDINGMTSLHYAAQLNYTEMVKLLLGTKGADVNVVDEYGRTPDRVDGVDDDVSDETKKIIVEHRNKV